MRRKVFKVAATAAAVAASLTLGLRSILRGDEQRPAPARSSTAPASTTGEYMGVGSCASPACHGGPATVESDQRKGKKWKSSYTIWVDRDKHAQAYRVLYEERSKIIASNLHLCRKPYNEPRCLACHSTIKENSRDRCPIVGDGVGCESCHGPARSWLTEHYAVTFKPDDPATYRDPHEPAAVDERGPPMVNTRNMAVRAEVCVDCHVGAPARNGLPARNMDHDMIAAGHPRLTFDFRTYLANMPHHWDDSEEKSRKDCAAHTWAVGQIAATEGALQLLAARAQAAANGKGHWPEFSEYDCFTCHHGLASNSYRQGVRRGPPGRYEWGTWYLPATRLLISGFPKDAALLMKFDSTSLLMSAPIPTALTVAGSASAAAVSVHSLLLKADSASFTSDIMNPILNATAAQPATDWDTACGQYLLLRAAYSDREDLGDSLVAMRKLLQYRDVKQETGPPIRYNSPFDFNPEQFETEKNSLFMHEKNNLRKLLPTQ